MGDLREALKGSDGEVSWRAAEALDNLEPGWDGKIIDQSKKTIQIVPEVLAEKPADAAEVTAKEAEKFVDAIAAKKEGERIRQQIRDMIAGGVAEPKEIYEAQAKAAGVSLELWLACGLREAGAETIEKFLVQEMGYTPSEIAEWAGQYHVNAAVFLLIGYLKDSDVEVRMYATEALGQLGDKSAVGDLREVLKDADERVRMYASEALGRLGDKVAVGDLREALKDSD